MCAELEHLRVGEGAQRSEPEVAEKRDSHSATHSMNRRPNGEVFLRQNTTSIHQRAGTTTAFER